MRPARSALLLALAASSAACTLLTSLDGLQGGAAPAVDGGPGVDGGGDGGDAGTADRSAPPLDDGATGSWCATHQGDASFCDDFDTQDLTQWDGITLKGGGTARRDTVSPSSPPYALLSDLPPVTTGLTEAFLARTSPTAVSELSVGAQVRVEKAPASGAQLQLVKLLQVSPGAQAEAWEVGVAQTTTRKLVVYEYTYASGSYVELFTAPAPVALGTWMRVELHLLVNAALDGTVDLDVDGARIASGLAARPTYPKAPFRLFIGAVFTDSPHTGWTVRTDNVLLDAR